MKTITCLIAVTIAVLVGGAFSFSGAEAEKPPAVGPIDAAPLAEISVAPANAPTAIPTETPEVETVTELEGEQIAIDEATRSFLSDPARCDFGCSL